MIDDLEIRLADPDRFGAWHDVAWYGIRIADPPTPPDEPIPLPELTERA